MTSTPAEERPEEQPDAQSGEQPDQPSASRATRFDVADDEQREAGLAAAVTAIRDGGLVVLPTDTVYGVGADAFEPDAVQRLLDAKGRGREMPPPVLVSAASTLDALASDIPEYARTLTEHYWPGALTVVVRQQTSLQWDLGDTKGTVAVRMPDDELALELLGRTGPLAVSSANLTGHAAATDADAAEEMLGDRVEVILDAGESHGAISSTIVDCTGDRPRVLREGAIYAAEIDALVGEIPEGSGKRGTTRVREYLLVFLVSAAVSYLLCVVARELAMRVGAVARVRDRDVHEIPIPYFGGLAMLGGIAAGCLVAKHLPFLGGSQGQVFHDAGIVLVAGTIICLVGVVDDVIELDPLAKLGGQVAAAAFMVLGGVQLYSLNLPGVGQFALDPTQAIVLTIVLVVSTVNAVNFVDGLDGLAGGIVMLGAVAFFVFSYKLADNNGETLAITAALLCAALAGGCAGFLPHNFFPARLFMGDSGSMLLGLVLSGSTLTLTGQFASVQVSGDRSSAGLAFLIPILLPLAILLVPLSDMVLAVIRRTRRGVAFYQPDKEHLHHRLLQIGHTQRRAVLIMWTWCALVGFGVVLVALYPARVLTWLIVGVGFVGALVATFLLPRLQRPGGAGTPPVDAVR